MTGVIPILRALSACQALTTEQLALQISSCDIKKCLAVLQNIYGTVVQEDGCWRLRHRLEWLKLPALNDALGNVIVTDETSSTNDLARQHNGIYFFSEHQTQGRGRRGRTWLALPAASILMSMRLPSPPQLSGLSLAVGTALWRTLAGDERLLLKWPNDLMDSAGRKVGGVLIETAGESVIIGVGLNLFMTPHLQAHIDRPVGGLAAALGENMTRHYYATLIATTLREAVQAFEQTCMKTFLDDAVRAHCIKMNMPFSLILNDYKKNGVFAGFDNNGALMMRCGKRLQSTVSGEIAHVAGS